MAKTNLYKCDICGELYEGGEHKYLIGSYSSNISISDYGKYDKIQGKYKRYDLCPCCMTHVRKYIESLADAQKCGVAFCPVEKCKGKWSWRK